MTKIEKIKKDKKLLLSYIMRSQKAILRNTKLLEELERQEEIISSDLLPGFDDVKAMCVVNCIGERSRLIKYMIRSQKAILKNTKLLKKLEKQHRDLIQPLLEV